MYIYFLFASYKETAWGKGDSSVSSYLPRSQSSRELKVVGLLSPYMFIFQQHYNVSSTMGFHVFRVLFIICIVAQDVASLRCRLSDAPTFKHRPSSRIIQTGESTVLECVVTHFNILTDKLNWQLGPDNHRKEVSEHFDDLRGEYSSVMTVYNIGRRNVHVSCTVTYSTQSNVEYVPQQGSEVCYITSRATIIPEYFPLQNELLCSPTNPPALHEGDILIVRCEVPRCEPAVDLDWNLLNESSESLPFPTLRDEGRIRVLTHDIQIRRNYHSKSIACVVTSEVAFPGQQISCTIGPIQVLQAPRIEPRHGEVNFTKGESIQLNCRASGVPESTYEWSCSPEGILSGCSGTRQSVTLSLTGNVTPDTRYVLVTCQATNSEGIDSSHTRVMIAHRILREDVLNESGEFSSEITILRDNDYRTVELLCNVYPKHTQDTVNFTWFLDERPVSDDDSPTIRQISNTTSSIRLYPKNSNAKAMVDCKASIGQSVVYSSANITFNKTRHNTVERNLDVDKWVNSSNEFHFPNTQFSGKSVTVQTYSQPELYLTSIQISITSTGQEWDDVLSSYGMRKFSMSKMTLIVIIAIISFILLTACGVIIVVLIRRKIAFRPSRDISMATPTVQDENGPPIPIIDSVDALYEIPGPTTEQTYPDVSSIPTPASCGLDHAYDSQVFSTSSCSSTDSSFSESVSPEESWSSLSQKSVHECDCCYDNTPNATYVNQSLLDIRAKHRKNSFLVSQEGEKIMEKCLNIPLPEMPTADISHLTDDDKRHSV